MAISNEKDQKEIWSYNKIIEELHYDLISAKGEDGLRKYEQQAGFLLHRIPIWRTSESGNKQPPLFTVDLEDISEEVKKHLLSFPKEKIVDIVKEAVSHIFENLGT